MSEISKIKKQRKKPIPVVRKYRIDDVTYIVTASVSDRAREDAKPKIQRLIEKEIHRLHDIEQTG